MKGGTSGVLTTRDLIRYDRQLLIIGKAGQEKLKRASVAIVGIGGLGSPAAFYLAGAGVGRLILIDPEIPELSNLNRQIIHWEGDFSLPKAQSAAQKLRKFNSDIVIEPKSVKITKENVSEVLSGADVIVDGLDNFETRYLLNEYCLEHEKPFVHAAVRGLVGQATTIVPQKSPCLRCIFPESPKAEEKFPILGGTAGTLGCIEAIEAIKLITGFGRPLIGRLLITDLEDMTFNLIRVKRRPDCSVCGGLHS
ncbi:MAG: adenylyltransferase [Thermoproteota archaeon]|nr:MAG: adenylyltransferase [Candidatus Korarchaeota archaeon]